MKIITNENDKPHLDTLKELISKSKKIQIAVSFLKKSGLNLVKNDLEKALKKGAEIEIVCGRDFYLTEPEALYDLFNLFEDYPKGKVYLYNENSNTFHPKLYFFIKGNTAYILIGSANFTRGGFQDNIEISTLETTKVGDALYKKIDSFFKTVRNKSEKANRLSINQYERRYENYHPRVQKAEEEAKKEIKKIHSIKVEDIKRYLVDYKKEEQNNFHNRISNYNEAKQILDKMIESCCNSKKEFMYYYEQLVGKKGGIRLWYSTGLYRQKNMVAKQYKTFIKMLRDIKENIKKSPEKVFEIGLKYINKIKGLGVNVLTEIMNTYAPKRFSVLNNNTLTTLKELGYSEFPAPNTFKPKTYADYNWLISEIMEICNFESMGQADHFLYYIYWKYVKK